MADVVHRALDGRRYRLAGPLDLGRPCTSVVQLAAGGRVHELTAGAAALGEEVAVASGVPRLDEELSLHGGRLRLGRATHYDGGTRLTETVLVAVWQGRRHSLVTVLYGGTASDAVTLLRSVRIDEHDDGLALRPAGGELGPATVIKQVPRLGLLEVSPLTAQHARSLPRWQGVATGAGELFRDTLPDGSPYFVLAGRDTWTTVMPLADTTLADVPALAGRLELQAVAT